VTLDSLAARERNIALLERYGALLTDNQRAALDLHLRSDWSLAEIAERESVSRAAVHDVVRRALQTLEDAERRLGLFAEEERRRKAKAALGAELAEVRRRLDRLEARIGDV
jgi:predicted DNA-binding protein YlxM (UPF0122 family)